MKHYIHLIYVLIALALFSCSSSESEEPTVTPPASEEPSVTPPASTKWTFSYTLPNKESQNTRVSGSDFQFDQLDAATRVGLFCIKSNGSYYLQNQEFKAGDDGTTLVRVDGKETDKLSDKCKIIAYAPYSNSTAFASSVPEGVTFPVQLDQTTTEGLIASDLLWAEADADELVDNVDIDFRRVLPRWVIKISIGGGLQPKDFLGATFAIYNIRRQIGFNVKTGETDGAPSGYNIIKFLNIETIDESGEGANFVGTVIVPPQNSSACYLQIVFKDGVKLYFKFNPTEFKQGRQYHSDVQLTGYPNNIQADIKSWDEEDYNGFIKSE